MMGLEPTTFLDSASAVTPDDQLARVLGPDWQGYFDLDERAQRLVVWLALISTAALLAGCGGSGNGKGSAGNAPPSTTAAFTCPEAQLTPDDVPDALMPGLWPGSDLSGECDGRAITYHTSWSPGDTTVGGRTVQDAAQTICAQTYNDFEAYGTDLSVTVLAQDGSLLAAGAGWDLPPCQSG